MRRRIDRLRWRTGALATGILFCTAARSPAQCDGTWIKRIPTVAPSGRAGGGMAFDIARGQCVHFGGFNGATLNETWVWDGNNWAQKTPATSPSARYECDMAYDSNRNVCVLFGSNPNNAETWEWDGTNWTLRTPATSPSGRRDCALAFDSGRNVTVMFGGIDTKVSSETWEWDGTNWSQKSPATRPDPRASHAMAYDSARGVTVMFGGASSLVYNDTWEWDGTNWTQKSPSVSPSIRTDHAMVYDSARGVTVLFGGGTGTSSYSDTWEFDGSNWTQRKPSPTPTARFHAMAYDSTRFVTVLFGAGGFSYDNFTWEWAGPTPLISQQPADKNAAAGDAATFSVTASSPNTLTYRWRMNGNLLSDAGAISGSTTPTLSINPVAAENAGAYSCDVSNVCDTIASRAGVLSLAAQGGCGTCGVGMTAMMPFTLLALAAMSQKRRRRTNDEKMDR